MVFPQALTASLTLHPAPVASLVGYQDKARDSPNVIAISVAVDDSDAGACARGRPKDYRQAKGGPKGGLNSPENINMLICNIYLVNCGAPTRTRTADLLITNQWGFLLARSGHI